MYITPTIWEEVPGEVRRRLERPFRKQADGLAGLETAADTLGWRSGPINAMWGGPRPVTNLLVGSALGSLGGWGVGRLAQEILPHSYFDPERVRRRAMLMGAALGAGPALWQAYDNLRTSGGDPASFLESWPQPVKAAAQDAWVKEADDLFAPVIPRDAFNQAVWNDFNTPRPLQAATAGLVEAASLTRGGSDYVSPFDIARIAVGAGAGLVSGVIAGRALGLLAGLTPEGQQKIQQLGLWAGTLKAVVPQALGLR